MTNPFADDIDPLRPTRRGFLGLLVAGVIVYLLVPLRSAFAKSVSIPLTKLPELEPIGGSVTIKVSAIKIVLIRSGRTSISAFNPTCTHKKCLVKWAPELNGFRCKCHGSRYDENGVNIGGPAPRPLTRYPSTVEADHVIIELPD